MRRDLPQHLPIANPATLRERAEQCSRLAKNVTSRVNAETLKRIAKDYTELAERLEEDGRQGRKPGRA